MKPALRVACAAATIATNFLAFPHPVGDDVMDLGIVFAWIFPAMLLLTLRGLAPKPALRWGFVVGTLSYAAVLHWIYVVTVHYGRAPVVVGFIAPLLLAAWPGIFVALFAAARAWLWPRGLAGPFVVAALFTVLETLRGIVLGGMPWASLGYAQIGNPALLGLAAWTGVHGLTFTSVLLPASVLYWLAPPTGEVEGRAQVRAAIGLGAVAALHILGMIGVPDPVEGPRARVAVLQGNIEQGVKWSPDWAERTLSIYTELSRSAAREGASWIVWPETAVPGSPDADRELSARLGALARETGASLVVGAVGARFIMGPDGEPQPPELFDSAFSYGPDGRRLDRYDKTHLVPFGEFLPLRPLLGFFINAIATGSAGRDVTPGDAPRNLALPAGPELAAPAGSAGPELAAPAGSPGDDAAADPARRASRQRVEPSVPVGVPICYELLFPDLVRRFAADGAGMLMGITNDAWYGRTGAPFQFLAMTAMRSAETGLWTARAANTGVSAFIDGQGRVRSRTRIFERGFLVEEVPLATKDRGATFYTRAGDWFPWVCGLTCILVGLAGRRQRGELG